MWLLKLNVLLVFCVKFSMLTAISNVDKIFEVFSASSLVRFFEFNSGGWNLTEDCAKKLFQYLEALQGDMLWAIKCKIVKIKKKKSLIKKFNEKC